MMGKGNGRQERVHASTKEIKIMINGIIMRII